MSITYNKPATYSTPVTYNTSTIEQMSIQYNKSVVWVADKVDKFLKEDEEKFTSYDTSDLVYSFNISINGNSITFNREEIPGHLYTVNDYDMVESNIEFSGNASTNVLYVNLSANSGSVNCSFLDVGDYYWDEELGQSLQFMYNNSGKYGIKIKTYLPSVNNWSTVSFGFDYTGSVNTANTLYDRTTFNNYLVNDIGSSRVMTLANMNLFLTMASKFRDQPEVQDLLKVIENLYFDIKAKSEGVSRCKDPDNFPEQFAYEFASMIGLLLNNTSTMSVPNIRQQIAYAVEWYKIKGTEFSLGTYLYSCGLYEQAYTLYTKTYAPGDFFKYEDIEGDPDYYQTPHYQIQITPGNYFISADNLKSIYKRVDTNAPAHVVASIIFSVAVGPNGIGANSAGIINHLPPNTANSVWGILQNNVFIRHYDNTFSYNQDEV